MLKVCSFLPAVTQMIYDMGLQEQLVGITFECPEQALKEKPTVVQCVLEGKNLSSGEINDIFSASKRDGDSLYYVKEDLLEQLSPDVIFTQDVCEVCQIDTECTLAAVSKLQKQPEIISITPQSLEDVFRSAEVIATAMGHTQTGYQYTSTLRKRIADTQMCIRETIKNPKKVFFMEWMDPIFNSGHWIPEQVLIAGGEDGLSNPCGDSRGMHWEEVRPGGIGNRGVVRALRSRGGGKVFIVDEGAAVEGLTYFGGHAIGVRLDEAGGRTVGCRGRHAAIIGDGRVIGFRLGGDRLGSSNHRDFAIRGYRQGIEVGIEEVAGVGQRREEIDDEVILSICVPCGDTNSEK
ncbi:MAG: hypothetical protein AAF361_02255 [Bacteroidota bacterium]